MSGADGARQPAVTTTTPRALNPHGAGAERAVSWCAGGSTAASVRTPGVGCRLVGWRADCRSAAAPEPLSSVADRPRLRPAAFGSHRRHRAAVGSQAAYRACPTHCLFVLERPCAGFLASRPFQGLGTGSSAATGSPPPTHRPHLYTRLGGARRTEDPGIHGPAVAGADERGDGIEEDRAGVESCSTVPTEPTAPMTSGRRPE